MKDILFLGASGFLGRALIRHFASLGHRTHALVRSEASGEKVRSASPGSEIIFEQDLGGRRFDQVFNLVVDYGRSNPGLAALVRTNVDYPLGIIERVECDGVINVSTALPEDYSDYAASKRQLERALVGLPGRRPVRCLNVHLHNMYGPGSDSSNLVTFLISKMLTSEPVDLSLAENSRDFIHIDDLVLCLTFVSDRFDAFAGAEPLEVGSGEAVRLRDLAETLREMTGSNSPLNFGARAGNPREPHVLAADISRLSAEGWEGARPLRQGLEETIRWARETC